MLGRRASKSLLVDALFVLESQPPFFYAPKFASLSALRWLAIALIVISASPYFLGAVSLPIAALALNVWQSIRAARSGSTLLLQHMASPHQKDLTADEVNGSIAIQLQSVCHDALRWLISVSLVPEIFEIYSNTEVAAAHELNDSL